MAFAKAACTPFKVHADVHLPAPPQIEIPQALPLNWESDIAEKIGAVNTQGEFPRIYKIWRKNSPFNSTEHERYKWLHCLYYYVSMDTDKNGVPDWDAISDQRPAMILFPKDFDQDGDGIPNIFDADPLNFNIKTKTTSKKIPDHLKIKRSLTAALQEELFKKFNILAIDHTDEHSPVVLQELISVLENGFPKGFQLKNLRYIYAFAGHDPSRKVAAYHVQAQALSIAGVTSYTKNNMHGQKKNDLIAALIHEIGHAILFEKLTAQKLSKISVKFADWNPVDQKTDSFFDLDFFKPYAFKNSGAELRKNIVSEYSMTNQHEWFAESLTAAILNKLGRQTSYANISHEFQQLLESLIQN